MKPSDRGFGGGNAAAAEESTAVDHGHGGPLSRVVDRDLTPEAAAHLTVARGYPCISVLMPTTPAPQMAIADRERLDSLLLDLSDG